MIVEGIDDFEDMVKKIGEKVMDFEEEVVCGRRECEEILSGRRKKFGFRESQQLIIRPRPNEEARNTARMRKYAERLGVAAPSLEWS